MATLSLSGMGRASMSTASSRAGMSSSFSATENAWEGEGERGKKERDCELRYLLSNLPYQLIVLENVLLF